MPLDQGQLQKVQDWLTARLGHACPVCKSTGLNYGDTLLLPVSAGAGQQSAVPKGYIPVSCTECGYTILLSEFFLK